MPRKSSVKRLPPEILTEINELLSSKRATLDEIIVHLRNLGIGSVSRSALGRHKQQLDKVVERLRQSREMAETIAQKLGPEAVEGKQGRALVQLLSAMTGEYMLRRMDDPEAETEAKEIMALARAVKDAAQASRYSQDFELKVREEARREIRTEMRERIKAMGTAAELKELTDEELERRIAELAGA